MPTAPASSATLKQVVRAGPAELRSSSGEAVVGECVEGADFTEAFFCFFLAGAISVRVDRVTDPKPSEGTAGPGPQEPCRPEQKNRHGEGKRLLRSRSRSQSYGKVM